jgi:hypothetical protein
MLADIATRTTASQLPEAATAAVPAQLIDKTLPRRSAMTVPRRN